jgi:hypothetical protein
VGEPPSREELFRRKELSNLYMRGVREGYEGELFGRQAEAMRDILDVLGEEGLRAYLMGVIEGEEDAEEDEAEAMVELEAEDEDDAPDNEDPGQEPHPN